MQRRSIMSQKKVDAYKARKGLHNKTDRKEKVLFGLEMFAWAFICVVIVAWIGYSAYVKVTGAKENVGTPKAINASCSRKAPRPCPPSLLLWTSRITVHRSF